jgi:hypothetical protein
MTRSMMITVIKMDLLSRLTIIMIITVTTFSHISLPRM